MSDHPPPRLRPAREADLPAMQAIYADHVLHGLASFEETPPSLEEMAQRLREVTDRGLPWLVAELDGEAAAGLSGELPGGIAGYAYAALYRARPGYRHSLEDSVYIVPQAAGRGVGRALLARVIEDSEALGYRQMVAVIGDSANLASIGLHEALGFRRVGVLRDIGFKFGRWVDTVILQRPLGPGGETLPEG